MHPDLHCHSYFSDGQHSPDYLIERAVANGVSHLSITDHDFVTGPEQINCRSDEIQIIPGVEISCQWQSREVHVVGLFIAPENDYLLALLARQREARKVRMIAMEEKLKAHGGEGLISYLQSLPCKSWTRSHVARFLIDNGHCKNWQKAFTRFLSRKGKIYVPFPCCELADATSAIIQAGGIAVMAHPGRYGLSKTRVEKLLIDFKAHGGEALEGSYGNIDPTTRKQLCTLAAQLDLFISVGSDFHDADRHWTDLGKLPDLDSEAKKNAIWCHPKWHF